MNSLENKSPISTDLNKDLRKLAELIKDIKTTMFTTLDSDGCLYSRPMMSQEINLDQFNGELWFFTSKSSGKIDSLTQNSHVNLAYAEPSSSKYVSVSGVADIVEDREKAKELWSPAIQAWFPKGIDDPDLALLKVSVERAEYWDSPASAVSILSFTKALFTGKRYQASSEEHKKIDLHH